MMSVPRPPTAPDRFSSGNKSQFGDLGAGPRHQFQVSAFNDIDYRHNHNARSNGPGQTQRPQSYNPQIHQEVLPHSSVSLGPDRATAGRPFPQGMGPGAGRGVAPMIIKNSQPSVTRYVCFQKKPTNRPWKNEWETCDHITMSIGPEETEKQMRRHDEPGKDIGTCISKLGKYQLRHLRKQEDKLNSSEKDPKNFKWVVSAVGMEKKPGGGASQTFWAIYSRQSRFRPTTAPGRAPIPRPQTSTHPSEPTPHHREQLYDGPIVIQPVEIPAPPRPGSFSGGRPATAGGYNEPYFQRDLVPEIFAAPAQVGYLGTSFGPLGSQSHDVNPVHQPFPQFSGPGPQIREVGSGSGRPNTFSQFQAPHPTDSFARPSARAPPSVEAQNFGYQQPHSAEPRASIPTISIHRPQSHRVDQHFQPEIKRSPHHTNARPTIKHQYQRTAPPPQQDQRRKRSSSLAAPRVRQERPDSHYQNHVDTRKNRHSTLELPDFPDDKMNRTDRWVESSMSGSSGFGTSTVGSGDGGSPVGEYFLDPPPMGKRRNSISTYTGKDYYTNSSADGLNRSRSINEGARNRRSIAGDYYIDSKPTAPARRATADYEIQYAANHRGRPSPKYVGYHDGGRKRSVSRKRSRSRHHGGHGSDSHDYEYESADEMREGVRNLNINNSAPRHGQSRPRYGRYVEFGK